MHGGGGGGGGTFDFTQEHAVVTVPVAPFASVHAWPLHAEHAPAPAFCDVGVPEHQPRPVSVLDWHGEFSVQAGGGGGNEFVIHAQAVETVPVTPFPSVHD